MPIRGLTEQHRLSRVGKIRLGIKLKSSKGVEYPKATDYFVCPPEVQAIYGDKPKALDVIIPVEDDEIWACQYYRQYSRTRGLVCKGDGETCRRMIDKAAGGDTAVATRDSKATTWVEGLECPGQDCEYYQKKMCQETMNLQVMLPRVPGLGVWQIDTGSVHSIRFINDAATTIRATCGKASWIPLTLTLEPTEVNNPEDDKKKTVYCMHLRTNFGLKDLMDAADKPHQDLLVYKPSDDEAPLDRKLNNGNAENAEEFGGQVEEDIDSLFGLSSAPAAPNPQAAAKQAPTAQGEPPTSPETLALFTAMRLKGITTEKQKRGWLKYTAKVKADPDTEPEKVWEEIRALIGQAEKSWEDVRAGK